MSVVAITGSSGYIGSRILKFLEGQDNVSRVLGIDLNPPHHIPAKLDLRRLDIRDRRLPGLFREENVEKIIHLAFVVNPIHDQDKMHDINLGGLRNVLTAVTACRARHLIIASSTTAFGAFPDNPEWLTEDYHPRRQPNFTYASDKYEVEMLAKSFKSEHPEVKVALVRPCVVYGPHVDNYLSRFLLRLPVLPQVKGAGSEMQFIHEDDAAEVFLKVLEQEAEGFFHAVGTGTLSMEKIAELAGKPIVHFPGGLLYPSMDLLWRLHAPLIEGSSGMIDFIRYRWTASDKITRQKLDLEKFRSTEEVLMLMLETHGVSLKD